LDLERLTPVVVETDCRTVTRVGGILWNTEVVTNCKLGVRGGRVRKVGNFDRTVPTGCQICILQLVHLPLTYLACCAPELRY
jgi:hypothetical protein